MTTIIPTNDEERIRGYLFAARMNGDECAIERYERELREMGIDPGASNGKDTQK